MLAPGCYYGFAIFNIRSIFLSFKESKPKSKRNISSLIKISCCQCLKKLSKSPLVCKKLTFILRNRAEYRLILSQRGRRLSWLKSDEKTLISTRFRKRFEILCPSSLFCISNFVNVFIFMYSAVEGKLNENLLHS